MKKTFLLSLLTAIAFIRFIRGQFIRGHNMYFVLDIWSERSIVGSWQD